MSIRPEEQENSPTAWHYRADLITGTPCWCAEAEVERETAYRVRWPEQGRSTATIGHVPPIECACCREQHHPLRPPRGGLNEALNGHRIVYPQLFARIADGMSLPSVGSRGPSNDGTRAGRRPGPARTRSLKEFVGRDLGLEVNRKRILDPVGSSPAVPPSSVRRGNRTPVIDFVCRLGWMGRATVTLGRSLGVNHVATVRDSSRYVKLRRRCIVRGRRR